MCASISSWLEGSCHWKGVAVDESVLCSQGNPRGMNHSKVYLLSFKSLHATANLTSLSYLKTGGEIEHQEWEHREQVMMVAAENSQMTESTRACTIPLTIFPRTNHCPRNGFMKNGSQIFQCSRDLHSSSSPTDAPLTLHTACGCFLRLL